MDTWREADESARHHLRCPLCGNLDFDREEGRIDSRWGVTSHKVVMMVCRNCGLILQFTAGRGIFDFD